MTRSVVPIANIQRRLPEAGRIRTGVKSGKAMKAIPHLRFTSHDEEALTQIAAMYGGTVQPWSDPKAAAGQFEVITEAPEIRVVLPPDPLGDTPTYELWGGGGCERRCDGLTANVLTQGPDGLEQAQVPCLCDAKGEMACQVVTRLNVILPEVRFAGVWRLDTKSWNAAAELPGMVEMVQQLQASGLAYAVLALKHRRSVQAGETRRFIVPVLGIPASIEQLAAGASRLTSLSAADEPRRALGAGSSGDGEGFPPQTATPAVGSPTDAPSPDISTDDEEVVEAEIVEPEVAEPGGGKATAAQTKRIFAGLKSSTMTREERRKWASDVLSRTVTSFSELSKDDAARLIDALEGGR